MAEKLNNVAFEWVTNELEEILRQARGALEAYVTDSNDSTKLRFTLTHCHQIHGTLSMVQLHNLASVAKEMEAVAGKPDHAKRARCFRSADGRTSANVGAA